jgi:tetratricopeptide (TPR) repeat protein
MKRVNRAILNTKPGTHQKPLDLSPAALFHNARRTLAGPAFLLWGALLAVATPAFAQEPRDEPSIQKCAQDDVASFAIPACTALITSANFKAPHFSIEDQARIFAWRGKAWMTEDDPAAAAADYTRALELNPANVATLKDRALAYTKLGEHAKAVQDWTGLLAAYPDNDQFYRSRGTSLLAAGRHGESLADFDKSLLLKPGVVEAYIGRAAVYDSLGDQAQARQEFERAIAVDPGYLAIYWERAVMAERWGEQKSAIKDYEMVLKINGVYSHARKALRRLGIEHPP